VYIVHLFTSHLRIIYLETIVIIVINLEKDLIDIKVTKIINNKTGNVHINVTLIRVRATIVAVEKQ
jgi:hypothetical protein